MKALHVLFFSLSCTAALFGNRAALAQTKMTIDEAMTKAEQYSLPSKIAQQSLVEAEARESQTWANAGPRMDAEANKVWISDSVNKLVGTTYTGQLIPSEITKGSLTVAQPLTPLFAIIEKARIDSELSSAARQEAKLSEKDARFAGAESFLRALKAKEFLAIAKSSLAVVEKQRRDGGILGQTGVLSNIDVYRLDLALSDARAQVIVAQNTYEIALSALSEIINEKIDSTLVFDHSVESYWERKSPSLEEAQAYVQAAESSRAEILAAESRAKAADISIGIGISDFFPVVNLFAKYERDFEMSDLNIPPTVVNGAVVRPGASFEKKDVQDTFTYGLNLKWTIWDWNARWRKTNELSASAAKARYAAEATRSRVRLEARQAYLEFRALVETLEGAKSAVRVAEETFRLTELRFQSGSASTTDLITSERDQTRARAQLINTRSDLDLAWLKLKKSIGGNIVFE